MIRVGIVGATGYGGRELLRLLGVHPEAGVVKLASTTAAGERLGDVLPAFRGLSDLEFENFDPHGLASACDVVFLGVPATESMALAAPLRDLGVRVVDLGPDFRLRDLDSFKTYYKTDHTAPELVQEAVYGLVPVFREPLRTANLVAVPGCYPISVVLPLRPLVGNATPSVPVIADSVSGVSGAGRSLSDALHFSEMNENMKAYKVGVHQHIPEIEEALRHQAQIQFTPHVAPLTRGILSTITIRFDQDVDVAAALSVYDNEPFVRVLPEGQLPEVKHVRGTNFCDIGWVRDDRTGNIVLLSAIDNLNGGTSGMAIQAMNLMFGVEETAGLVWGGMAP